MQGTLHALAILCINTVCLEEERVIIVFFSSRAVLDLNVPVPQNPPHPHALLPIVKTVNVLYPRKQSHRSCVIEI